MRIIVKCIKCGCELDTEATVDMIDSLIIKVKACGNTDCYDCSKCETDQKLNEITKIIKKCGPE